MRPETKLHPIQLPRLCGLRTDMEYAGVGRVSYRYRTQKANIEVVFVIDTEPGALLIGILGLRPYAFEVPLVGRCSVMPHLGHHYGDVLDALGIEPNSENPFSTITFYRYLAQHAPGSVAFTSAPPPELLARFWPDVEEVDKVYFVGWVKHGDGRHVTAENLHKTGRLLSASARNSCARYNISSRWSASFADKKPVTDPRGDDDQGEIGQR